MFYTCDTMYKSHHLNTFYSMFFLVIVRITHSQLQTSFVTPFAHVLPGDKFLHRKKKNTFSFLLNSKVLWSLEAQPVHSTADSVVVRNLLNRT